MEADDGKTYEEARKPPITVHNAVSALGKDYMKKNYPGGGPVCATLACWQVMLKSREIKSVWSLQMDQIRANPKGGIWKGPKPKVNGSRRILKEPTKSPTTSGGCNLPTGLFGAPRLQDLSCQFVGFRSCVESSSAC